MTLYGVLQIVHVATCLAMIGIVLLQAGEGEGLTGAFGGGGSYAVFGKKGATGFVAKATTTCAIVFMLTSFTLAFKIRELKGGPSTLGLADAASQFTPPSRQVILFHVRDSSQGADLNGDGDQFESIVRAVTPSAR